MAFFLYSFPIILTRNDVKVVRIALIKQYSPVLKLLQKQIPLKFTTKSDDLISLKNNLQL